MNTAALRWFHQAEVGTPLLRRSGRTLRMIRAGAGFKRHVDADVCEQLT
jgi:hypothetical protein